MKKVIFIAVLLTGIIGFASAGFCENEALVVDENGNVGIGTTTPTFSTDFFGLNISDSNNDALDPVIRLSETGSGLGNFEIRSTKSGSGNMLQVGEGSDTFLTIRSDDDGGAQTMRGRIGIGTAYPFTKLHVHDSSTTYAAWIENTAVNGGA